MEENTEELIETLKAGKKEMTSKVFINAWDNDLFSHSAFIEMVQSLELIEEKEEEENGFTEITYKTTDDRHFTIVSDDEQLKMWIEETTDIGGRKRKLETDVVDNVKSPNHYKLPGLNIESIDVVKSVLGKDGFEAFCKGNVMKYVTREANKNGLEDLKKARVYLDWLIKSKEIDKYEKEYEESVKNGN